MILREHVKDGADVVAGVLTLGVWAQVVPVILGLLGILWFLLRFVNFYRVNVLGRDPWLFH